MTKLPAKCRGCQFTTTADCTCRRCTQVKAMGFCSDSCHQSFREEMDYEVRRVS